MQTRITLTVATLTAISLVPVLVPSIEVVGVAFNPFSPLGFEPIFGLVLTPALLVVVEQITIVSLTVEVVPDPLDLLIAELTGLLNGIAPQTPTAAPRIPAYLRRFQDEQDARAIFGDEAGADEGFAGEIGMLRDLLGGGFGPSIVDGRRRIAEGLADGRRRILNAR